MNAFRLTYINGDTQTVSFNGDFKEAVEYYLNQSFGYWDAGTCTEKFRTVGKVEEL